MRIFSIETSLKLQFRSASSVSKPLDKKELNRVLEKDDKEYMLVVLVAGSE